MDPAGEGCYRRMGRDGVFAERCLEIAMKSPLLLGVQSGLHKWRGNGFSTNYNEHEKTEAWLSIMPHPIHDSDSSRAKRTTTSHWELVWSI